MNVTVSVCPASVCVETVGAGQEKNPYWQAVSAANALRSWLWNHHKLFCDDGADAGELQESNFSVWPDVLILPRSAGPPRAFTADSPTEPAP